MQFIILSWKSTLNPERHNILKLKENINGYFISEFSISLQENAT